MIVRISRGRFGTGQVEEVERLLAASEGELRGSLERMPGLVRYYVGIDRESGTVTNTSVWDTLEHARAMSALQPMLAQRPILEAAGVEFDAIVNHEVLWSIET